MEKISLPQQNRDLLSLARKKYGRRTVIALIVAAVLVAAYVWYFIVKDYPTSTRLIAAAAYFAVFAGILYLQKIPAMLADRSWEAKVSAAEMRRTELPETDEGREKWQALYGATVPVYKNQGDERVMVANILHVSCAEDSGKTHDFEVNCNGTDFSPYYTVGCRVRHYHGIDRIIRVPGDGCAMRLCVDCGTLYADGTAVTNCGNCSASIIQE